MGKHFYLFGLPDDFLLFCLCLDALTVDGGFYITVQMSKISAFGSCGTSKFIMFLQRALRAFWSFDILDLSAVQRNQVAGILPHLE